MAVPICPETYSTVSAVLFLVNIDSDNFSVYNPLPSLINLAIHN